jgi:hypothetical protein
MIATHSIKDITFENGVMIINIDNQVLKFQLNKVSKKLLDATDLQRQFYRISPSGYGIHWPMIDEDLSIEHLIKMSDN